MILRNSLSTLTLVVIFFVTCPTAPGQDSVGQDIAGKSPGVNPFGQMMSGLNPANWKMPQLKMPSMSGILPTKNEKDRVIKKKNGLVEEVSNTAKQSWQRTKNTLNPMRLIPTGFKQNQQTTPAPKKEGGFFSNLFSPKPAAKESNQSVTDWLKQDPVR